MVLLRFGFALLGTVLVTSPLTAVALQPTDAHPVMWAVFTTARAVWEALSLGCAVLQVRVLTRCSSSLVIDFFS